MQLLHAAHHDLDIDLQITRQLFLLGTLVRDELVQRRVNQSDGDREAIHGFEDADEIAALERKQFVQGLDASLPVVGEDHFLDGALALVAPLRLLEIGEEHVFRAAEANALCPELDGLASVLRSVHIRADPKATRLIGPLHQRFVRLGKLWNDQWHRLGVDHTFAAIEGDPIPFLHDLAVGGHRQ